MAALVMVVIQSLLEVKAAGLVEERTVFKPLALGLLVKEIMVVRVLEQVYLMVAVVVELEPLGLTQLDLILAA
jgi:hypothetical protein